MGTSRNIKKTDSLQNTIVGGSEVQYYVAEIATPFHKGNAVVKLNRAQNIWHCLFTLRDEIVAAICGFPIEEAAVVRILREQRSDSFDEYTPANRLPY